VAADTAILLTPPGAAAIAAVRVAGPRTLAFLRDHFSREPREGRCVHGQLTDDGRVIDDPVVVLGPGGAWADVNVHGGPWVVRSVLELTEREGFKVVEHGLDAADGVDALEREVFAHLPHARTELAVRALLAQPVAWADVRARGDDAVRAAARAALDDAALVNLLRLPRVALVGPANAGKSTLANQLFAQERSITADLPGTTRDWVGEVANVAGLAVMLVDTPGLRDTADAIERHAITIATREATTADLVVLVLDASRPLDPDQRPLLARFAGAVRVVNKSDVPCPWKAEIADAIDTVGTTGEGLGTLRTAIADRFACAAFDVDRPRAWTERQRDVFRRAGDTSAAIERLWATQPPQ
jgi:tRNA modification GTPase